MIKLEGIKDLIKVVNSQKHDCPMRGMYADTLELLCNNRYFKNRGGVFKSGFRDDIGYTNLYELYLNGKEGYEVLEEWTGVPYKYLKQLLCLEDHRTFFPVSTYYNEVNTRVPKTDILENLHELLDRAASVKAFHLKGLHLHKSEDVLLRGSLDSMVEGNLPEPVPNAKSEFEALGFNKDTVFHSTSFNTSGFRKTTTYTLKYVRENGDIVFEIKDSMGEVTDSKIVTVKELVKDIKSRDITFSEQYKIPNCTKLLLSSPLDELQRLGYTESVPEVIRDFIDTPAMVGDSVYWDGLSGYNNRYYVGVSVEQAFISTPLGKLKHHLKFGHNDGVPIKGVSLGSFDVRVDYIYGKGPVYKKVTALLEEDTKNIYTVDSCKVKVISEGCPEKSPEILRIEEEFDIVLPIKARTHKYTRKVLYKYNHKLFLRILIMFILVTLLVLNIVGIYMLETNPDLVYKLLPFVAAGAMGMLYYLFSKL